MLKFSSSGISDFENPSIVEKAKLFRVIDLSSGKNNFGKGFASSSELLYKAKVCNFSSEDFSRFSMLLKIKPKGVKDFKLGKFITYKEESSESEMYPMSNTSSAGVFHF